MTQVSLPVPTGRCREDLASYFWPDGGGGERGGGVMGGPHHQDGEVSAAGNERRGRSGQAYRDRVVHTEVFR